MKERDARHMFEWNRKFIHKKIVHCSKKEEEEENKNASIKVPWFSIFSRISFISTLYSIAGFSHFIIFFFGSGGKRSEWNMIFIILILSTSCPIYIQASNTNVILMNEYFVLLFSCSKKIYQHYEYKYEFTTGVIFIKISFFSRN
jgi:hypothetical protein